MSRSPARAVDAEPPDHLQANRTGRHLDAAFSKGDVIIVAHVSEPVARRLRGPLDTVNARECLHESPTAGRHRRGSRGECQMA